MQFFPGKFLLISHILWNYSFIIISISVFFRNIGAFKALVEFGADVNTKCHGTPPLHLIIRTMAQPAGYEFGLECLNLLLKSEEINLLAKDDNTFSILHLLTFFNFHEVLQNVFDLYEDKVVSLINSSSKTNGITPIHLGCMYDSLECVKILVAKNATINSALSICGSTPLHLAAFTKSVKVFQYLSIYSKDLLDVTDNHNRKPIDIIKEDEWKLDEKTFLIEPLFENKMFSKEEVSSFTAGSLAVSHFPNSPSSSTLIITNPLCFEHHTCAPSISNTEEAPPENIRRLHVLINETDGILRNSNLFPQINWQVVSKPAELTDVLRVHDWTYVKQVQAICEEIPIDAKQEVPLHNLDADTAISNDTFNAAMAAAGAVTHAVDSIMQGKARNTFCPIRPPGHHAGPRGVVKSGGVSDSHGFCIFNNVSIGASYAMNRYRDEIKKVAIVDFDVHHGNGTEETVRWLKPSIEEEKIYTQTWFGKMQAPIYKPWLGSNDSNNVLFVSVHGYGPPEKSLQAFFPHSAAFYPGTGPTTLPDINDEDELKTEETCEDQLNKLNHSSEELLLKEFLPPGGISFKPQSEDNEVDINHIDEFQDEDDEDFLPSTSQSQFKKVEDKYERLLRILQTPIPNPNSSKEIKPLILDIGVSLPDYDDDNFASSIDKIIAEIKYRLSWRKYFRTEIFPRLLKFSPDLILISAGFDAHKKDSINAGYISLVEDDFSWVTDNLIKIANTCSNGRVLSVLEGGYMIRGEYTSAFAKSVYSHIQSLNFGAKSRGKFNLEQNENENYLEDNFIANLEIYRDKEISRRLEIKRQKELKLMSENISDTPLNFPHEGSPSTIQKMEVDNNNSKVEEQSKSIEVEKNEGEDDLDNSSRRRKRPKVDYVALEKELREKSSSNK